MTTEEPEAGVTDTVPEPHELPEPGVLPAGSQMAFRHDPLFTGRNAELLALADLLFQQSGRLAIVAGPTGAGKTQLALEFVYRYGRFFTGGVYWFNFAFPETIAAAIAACGRAGALNLHPDFELLPLDTQIALVQCAWQEPASRLLVFDNCEDVALWEKWRPRPGGCRVLVTSRLTWRQTPVVKVVHLGPLPRSQSVALLRRLVPNLAAADAGAIAAGLGDRPLALHLAGSFLACCGAAESPAYLGRLRQNSLPSHASKREQVERLSPANDGRYTARAFAINYEQIEPATAVNARARALLACAACFAPGYPIPANLLLATLSQPKWKIASTPHAQLSGQAAPQTAGAGHSETKASFEKLLNLGLLRAESNDTVILHEQLAELVPGTAGVAEAQAAVEQAVLSALTAQVEQAGNLGPLPELAVHLYAITNRARPRQDTAAASLCNQLGYYLHELGDYSAARKYLEEALTIRRRLLGEQHLATATSLNNLGLLLQDMGNYAAAREHLEQALTILRELNMPLGSATTDENSQFSGQALGGQHLQIAGCLNNLAVLLRAIGDLPGARRCLEEALAIQQQILGQQHLDTAQSLNNLGRLLHEMADYPGAHHYLQEALAVYQQLLGQRHPSVATTLHNLGALLQEVGNRLAAQNYYEQALAIRRRLLGEQHPATVNTHNRLQHLLHIEGDSVPKKSSV